MKYQRKRRMKREERKEYIIRAFQWKKNEGILWGTMYDVAPWVGMKPSNHLLKYLYELVSDGELDMHTDTYRKGVTRHWFSLSGTIKQETLFHVSAVDVEPDREWAKV